MKRVGVFSLMMFLWYNGTAIPYFSCFQKYLLISTVNMVR